MRVAMIQEVNFLYGQASKWRAVWCFMRGDHYYEDSSFIGYSWEL